MTSRLRSVPVAALAALVAAAVPLAPAPVAAQQLGGQWYAGLGGGAAKLEPNSDVGLDVDENAGTAATVFLGRDLDARSSVQLQLYGLGEAEFDGGETVDYLAGDAAVLYRFFDTRDRAIGPRALNLAVYGRFGLGFMERDTDASLEDDSPVWFGAGAGVELGLGRRAALRLEGLYHDTDAGSALLSVLVRFGGRGAVPSPAPSSPGAPLDAPPGPLGDSPTTAADTAGTAAPPTGVADDGPTGLPADAPADLPAGTGGTDAPAARAPVADDADGDGVTDADDVCPGSTPGFPVRDNGCALLDGVLSGVRFVDGEAELVPGATDQLDYLAGVLSEFPAARVELHAHTDDFETPREQAILTRARLRTVGTYLVGRGVSANRLVLRSFGGARPIADNATAEGRAENNRIEVLENVRP